VVKALDLVDEVAVLVGRVEDTVVKALDSVDKVAVLVDRVADTAGKAGDSAAKVAVRVGDPIVLLGPGSPDSGFRKPACLFPGDPDRKSATRDQAVISLVAVTESGSLTAKVTCAQ
jgi:hypothetical protein